MLPIPSRLKSETSELSPVLTTPPPVLPKTVLVRRSVEAPIESSNFVVELRRRRARSAHTNPSSNALPRPISTTEFPNSSSSIDVSGCAAGACNEGLAFDASGLPVFCALPAPPASVLAGVVAPELDGVDFCESTAASVGDFDASAFALSVLVLSTLVSDFASVFAVSVFAVSVFATSALAASDFAASVCAALLFAASELASAFTASVFGAAAFAASAFTGANGVDGVAAIGGTVCAAVEGVAAGAGVAVAAGAGAAGAFGTPLASFAASCCPAIAGCFSSSNRCMFFS